MKNSRDITRQAILLTFIGVNAIASEYATGASTVGGYTNVVSAVRTGAITVLWLALYLLVSAVWCGRPVIKELPILTMQSIWAHVYGLGLLVFVSVYCLLGVSSGCTAAFLMSCVGVSFDDIIVRHRENFTKRAALFLCSIMSAATAVLTSYKAPDFRGLADSVDAGNWFVIACGGVLPLASPFLYNFIRGTRRYSPCEAMEFIRFATPFAVILSLVVLCTLSVMPAMPEPPTPAPLFPSAQRDPYWSFLHPGNNSNHGHMRRPHRLNNNNNNNETAQHKNVSSVEDVVDRILMVTSMDIAQPLLPFTMLPALFMAVQTALDYSIVDFLSAFSVVIAVKYLCHSPPHDPAPYMPCIAAALALALRMYASFQDNHGEPERSAYTSEELSVVSKDEDEEEEECNVHGA